MANSATATATATANAAAPQANPGATPIERTPNIGATLAAELRGVGIDSLEALMRVGFWDAWLQLRRVNPERNSVPACLALAGAVAGVRWNHLPPKVRADIRQRVKAVRT